jgi:hypothetical protein
MHITRSVLQGLGLMVLLLGAAAASDKAQEHRPQAKMPKKAPPAPAQRASTMPRPAPPLPAALGPQELQIAAQVHTGLLPCELGQSVVLQADARAPGYFSLRRPGFRYHMRPVISRTGTIRLEDEKAQAVWLQLADKSMLMDHKRGRRLADACAHPQQLAVAAEMKHQPPAPLFETQGMGRED